jgi:hypothetical protein
MNTSKDALVRRPYIYLRKNTVETEDNVIYPFETDYEGDFYDIGKSIERPLSRYDPSNKNLLAMTYITLSREEVNHERSVYMFLDLLGDLGGLTEVFKLAFGFFLYTISEHSFYLQATKRLFLAKTRQHGLFLKPNIQEEGEFVRNSLKHLQLEQGEDDNPDDDEKASG